MKVNKRVLRVIRSKIKQMNPDLYSDGSYWCIYGTPTEILILIDKFKVKCSNPNPFHIKWIRENHKKAGCSNPMWFYFHISHKKLNARFKELQNELK